MMICFEFVTYLCIEISREDSENEVNLNMSGVIDDKEILSLCKPNHNRVDVII